MDTITLQSDAFLRSSSSLKRYTSKRGNSMRHSLILLTICSVLLLPCSAQTTSTVVAAGEGNQNKPIVDLNVDFVSAGPWNHEQSGFYRVSFLVSEIYYSLVIEKISIPEDEGESMKLIDSHFYNGFRIGDVLPKERYGRLTNLKFIEWSNWKSFVLQEGSTRFSVEINGDEILIRTE